ncbi:hypothetical protein BBK36DRAFT_21264 [Trichoderma citrinoviride]|uniref:Fucose-specific lectin n=1 Tax=Trichoderma citrinoviride TaxID=58853 RepID=A0A2T4B821_9HYPO|nr:hypothetical protein BBK36DRAFT_21264 [Trichoderma citrinoviride]PTB65477.1 hypothetical protein BBK36DRAFT_21264 [Trichoderma citrinoviride]
MAPSVKSILRILHAAGGFIPEDSDASCYVVVEESNELSEQRWVESQLASETFIASNIRTNSPAVYSVHEDTRSVFCIGENNALRLFTLVEDEWHEVHLSGNEEILVHQSGRLSGCVYGGDSVVFFEDVRGYIRGIRVKKDGRWRFLRPLSANSVPGSPHFAQVQENVVHLSYVNWDGYIHQMGIRTAPNINSDNPLSGTNFTNSRVANFTVRVQDKIEDGKRDEAGNEPRDEPELYLFALTKKQEGEPEELVCIDSKGKPMVMGRIVDGVFEPASDRENNRPVIKSASTAVGNATGGGKGGKGKRR